MPKCLVVILSLLILLSCQRTQVRTYPSRPTERIPPATPRVQTPPESGSPIERDAPLNYSAAVSKWTSYKELVRWMEHEFSFDPDRFQRYDGKSPPFRSPEETFRLRSGIYMDAVLLARDTLNRIHPSYQAKILVILVRPNRYNHYVCSFREGGRIWVMDYGTPYKEVTGLLGPFSSLEEYRAFYEKNHPVKRSIEAVIYLDH